MVYSLGASVHHFDLDHRTVTGIDAAGQPASASARPMRSFSGVSFDNDVGFTFGPVYLGMEMQFGGGGIGAPLDDGDVAARGQAGGSAFGITGGGPFISGGLDLAVTVARTGSLDLMAEIFGGGTTMFLTPDAASAGRYPCTDDGCEMPGIASWTLEPRVRVRGWLHPNVGLDTWIGRGVGPSEGDWSLGVALSLHFRPFDGQR